MLKLRLKGLVCSEPAGGRPRRRVFQDPPRRRPGVVTWCASDGVLFVLRSHKSSHTHANPAHDTKCPLLSLKCLDPGSGRKISAIWLGAGANLDVFIPETLLVLRMGNLVLRF